ncbi:hypothetical protein MHYP_G00097170 [Metynnis hypsauchen]
MSLHELLREGQEAPQRIFNRVSQLLHSLSVTVLQGGSFSTYQRRSSWREWNGETGRHRVCGGQLEEMEAN